MGQGRKQQERQENGKTAKKKGKRTTPLKEARVCDKIPTDIIAIAK